MNQTIITFLLATAAVTIAEMGDKTQLLAMAFATKYKASKVMLGVFIATILNHGAAVAIGTLLTKFKSMELVIQGIASASFILFGLWTIRGDKLEGEQNKQTKFGAVATVAFAFFIAELGDKTQLATIALAARYPQSPVAILMGTTTGMLIADGIGIIVGVLMCKRIPERVIKYISASVFAIFGFIGIYELLVSKLGWQVIHAILLMIAGAFVTILLGIKIAKKSFGEAANEIVQEYCALRQLHDDTHQQQ